MLGEGRVTYLSPNQNPQPLPHPSFPLRGITVINKKLKKTLSKLWRSKRAVAIPVTFLILFVSLVTIISATYCFAVTRISAKATMLQVSAAKQSMLQLDYSVGLTAWSPGASEVSHFDDCGGELKTKPSARTLTLNLTVGSFYEVVFNSSLGEIVYELPPSESSLCDFFLRGDSRTIVNQSFATMTQLFTSTGAKGPNITLAYRPLASCARVGLSSGKPLNSLRVYIINLNSSDSVTLQGVVYLRATCVNVVSNIKSYNFTSPVSSLTIQANLDGVDGHVEFPISSNAEGAIVNLELIVCHIRLMRVLEG
ncbi:MAG: hypothetical protein U9O89_05430 [Thermoproteota archaeon]|nr:hypothetical protein [Thermoproteota archaeon]